MNSHRAAIAGFALALVPLVAQEPPGAPAPGGLLPAPIELPLAWRLTHSLCEPETAVRDPRDRVIYISNVCGFSKDGHGYISKLSDGGELLDRYWVDGLDAPAGLALSGRSLWAVDVDVVREVDLDSGRVVATLTFPPELEVRALNDLVIAPDGTLYVSDSGRQAIYSSAPGREAELLVRDDRLRFVNGLHLDGDILWVGTGTRLYTVRPDDGSIAGPIGPPELADVNGIESDGSGGLLLSLAGGPVWHLPAGGGATILTTAGLSSTNLGYFPEIGLIVVPTGTDGTVLAFPFPASQPANAVDPTRLRVATFNVRELSTGKIEAVSGEGLGTDPQLRAAAEIVRRVRPDVLVLQEIDHDLRHPDLTANGRRFVERYLAAPGRLGSGAPLAYPYLFAAPVNTGVPSGHDLDNDGKVMGAGSEGERGYGEDGFGFGSYPGQYATILLSRFPIQGEKARVFQRFLWKDLPGNHLPRDFYSAEEIEILRLSSKSHWDVPISIGEASLRLWISHPTPPVYDGPEDRNGRRNHDEIAFWIAYLDGEPALRDDAGVAGGRTDDAPFLIAGDLNADPVRGDAFEAEDGRAIARLLADPRIGDPGALLVSGGALVEAPRDAAAPERPGAPEYPERATSVFLGGMRIDYLLPSDGLRVLGGGVFWPTAEADPEGASLAELASDHRLVWIDLEAPRP